jgi:hypothetical protein
MDENWELETLLALDDSSYELAEGYLVEIKAERTDATKQRPHGISYALVLRQKGKDPLIRFDNSHAVERASGRYVRRSKTYDHWHRSEHDRGRPYAFTTGLRLLEDFWREVKRVLNERGIPNDL